MTSLAVVDCLVDDAVERRQRLSTTLSAVTTVHHLAQSLVLRDHFAERNALLQSHPCVPRDCLLQHARESVESVGDQIQDLGHVVQKPQGGELCLTGQTRRCVPNRRRSVPAGVGETWRFSFTNPGRNHGPAASQMP